MASVDVSTDANGITVTVRFMEELRAQRDHFSTDHLWGAPSPRDGYDAACNTLEDLLNGVGVSTVATFGPFPLPPVLGGGGAAEPALPDPMDVLQQIVDGINAAESKLNIQNFVIASGMVEAKLTLPVAGVTITFNISPRPYA